jgi:hypothetical protein
LANYIESAYGSKNYFGGDGTSTFAVPDWSADFPENGILCIKAQISSTAITFAEVDETGIYAGTDKVPSCERVAEIDEEIDEVQIEIAEKASKDWTQLKKVDGSGITVTIPNDANELLVILKNTSNIYATMIVPKPLFSDGLSLKATVQNVVKEIYKGGNSWTVTDSNYYGLIYYR